MCVVYSRYKDILVGDPNRRFEDTFGYFYDNYGQEDEIEIENNKDKMKAEWHPRDGFEVLKQRIKDGMMYASFANKSISTDDALNMMMVVITRTRLFATQYQEWHGRDNNDKTLLHAFEFWGQKVRLLKKYDRVAGTMGRGEEYGMAAGDDEEAKETEVVEDYALSMQLSNQNTMLQQQLQQQQQAINQLQQQAMYINSRSSACICVCVRQKKRVKPTLIRISYLDTPVGLASHSKKMQSSTYSRAFAQN